MDEKKNQDDQFDHFPELPRTITEFRIKPGLPEREQIMIEEYTTCVLCGSDLVFTHLTNFIDLTVEEESACPCCNIKNSKEYHQLH